MTGTAQAQAELYGSVQAWRPIQRKTDNKVSRDLALFTGIALKYKPTAKSVKSQLSRIAAKVPQAVVKVSKGAYGSQHIAQNFTYISRNGKIELRDQDDRLIESTKEMDELAKAWKQLNFDPDQLDRRYNAPDARRIIFSMPVGTPPDKVLNAARATARTLFGDNFDYVYALHTDEGKGGSPHPHVHLTVRGLGNDGKPLELRRGDLLIMRRVFALELRQRGIQVDATPQVARGPKVNRPNEKVVQTKKRIERHNANPRALYQQTFRRDLERAVRNQDRPYIDRDVARIYEQISKNLLSSDKRQDVILGLELQKLAKRDFHAKNAFVKPRKREFVTTIHPNENRPKL